MSVVWFSLVAAEDGRKYNVISILYLPIFTYFSGVFLRVVSFSLMTNYNIMSSINAIWQLLLI